MNLTITLKNWLVENIDSITKDSSDDEFKTAAATALANGDLTAAKFAELTADPQEKEANQFSAKLDSVLDSLSKLTEVLTKTNQPEEKKVEKKETEESEQKETNAPKLKGISKVLTSADEGKESDVRVKGAHEQYDTTKKSLTYPSMTKNDRPHNLAGQRVFDYSVCGRAVDEPSELDKAVVGAYAKFEIQRSRFFGNRAMAFAALTDHEKDLLRYGLSKMKWAGCTTGADSEAGNYDDIYSGQRGFLNDLQQKQLIDESAGSQGLEAVPIVFDDMVIQAPLLNGELFPLVNIVPIERGRRMEGVSTLTVTGGWGGIDNSLIGIFDTTAYVTGFNTNIGRWQGAFLIGLDFLSDTPIDFAAHVTAQYGERLLEDLDDSIATGAGGDNEPAGIQGSGITQIAWGDATSLGNYESLRFGVAKAEHTAAVKNTAVFIGTEVSYQRAHALPVGSTDARRLGGMDYDSYTWMNRPYKINESLTNLQIIYAILARYRMYRRRGLTFRTSTEGDTLIRNNELLITCTARYGGQFERNAAGAETVSAPA